MTKPKRSYIAAAAGILMGSGALLIFLIRLRGHGSELLDSIRMFYYSRAAAAFFLIVCMYFLRVLRWKLILSAFENIPLGSITSALLIGLLANNVLPARAGEIIRPYVLKKKTTVSFKEALSSVIVDRVFDASGVIFLFLLLFIPALTFAGTVMPWKDDFAVSLPSQTLITTAVIVFLIISASVILLLYTSFSRKAALHLWALMPLAIRKTVKGFIQALAESLSAVKGWKSCLTLFFLSAAAWFAQALSTYFIATGLGLDIGIYGAVLTTLAVCLAIILPQAPGYLGTYHLAASLAAESLQVLPAPAAAFAIMMWAMNIIPVTVAGTALLLYETAVVKPRDTV